MTGSFLGVLCSLRDPALVNQETLFHVCGPGVGGSVGWGGCKKREHQKRLVLLSPK